MAAFLGNESVVFYTELFVFPCGLMHIIEYSVNPGAGRALVKPPQKDLELFLGPFRPDFHFPGGGISYPA